MNRLIDPNEIRELAAFYEEVRHARLMNTGAAQRSPLAKREGRSLQSIPEPSRGSSIVVSPGDSRKSVLQVRPDNPGSEICCITVSALPINVTYEPVLFPPFPDDAFGPINSAVLVGRLEWGVGQATFEAFFDLNRGTVLSVPCNYVALSVDYTDFGVGGQPQFKVGASVAYGVQPQQRTSPVHFTQFLGTVGAGATIVAPIPPWAMSFSAMTNTPAATPPNLALEVIDSGLAFAGMMYTYTSHANTALNQENQYPIWNGAELVRVTNNEGLARAVNLIYTLSI